MRTPGIWGGTLGQKKDSPRNRSNLSSVLVAVLGAGASVAALALGLLTCVASSRARSRMGARSWSDRPASSGPSPPASPSPSNTANSAVTSALPTTTETGEEAEEEEEEEEEEEDLRSRHHLHNHYQQQLQQHREQAAYFSGKEIPSSATTIPVALPPPPRHHHHHHHLLQHHQQIKNPSAPPPHRHTGAGGGIRVATTLDQRNYQVGGGGVGGGVNNGNGGLTAPHSLYHGAHHHHLCLLRRHHGLQAKAPPTPSTGTSSSANTASTASSTASGTFAPHLQTPAAPMLQMESAMERLRQDVAAQRDRQVRLQSVRKDIELGLPPSISLPDGEEMPYGAASRLHLRDSDQESEIYQKCVRAPPNRTIFDGESPPPYRSSSAGILALGGGSTCGEWSGTTVSVGSYGGGGFVRCHSLSTSNNPCERTPMAAAAAAALAKKDSAASLGSHRSSSGGKGGRMSQHQCQKASSMAVQKGMVGHPTGHCVKVVAPVGNSAGQHKMGALPYHCQPQAPPPPPQPPPASVTVPMTSPCTTTAASSPVRMSPPPQPNSNRLGQIHPIPSALQQTQQQCPRQYQPNQNPRGPLASTHSRINVSPATLTPTILVPTTHVHKASSFPVGRVRDQLETTIPSTCPSRSHQLCEFSTSPKSQSGTGNSGASGSGGLLAGLRMVPCMGSDRGVPCSLGSEVSERHGIQDVSSASAECSVPQTPQSTATSLSRVSEPNWEGSGGGNSAVVARDAGNSWDSKVLSRSAPEVDVTATCREEALPVVVAPVTSSATATDPPSPAPHEQSSSLTRELNMME